MQLIQVVKYLEQIAISSPYIRSTGEGSVYTIMNGNPHSKYGVFVISQNQHYRDEYFDHFNFNLFVIDRLIDDLDSNRLQVQSIAKECITNILLTFKEKFYGVTYNTIRFNVFTEKFVDLCAGAYAQVEIIIPANLICSDNYGIEFDKDYTLKPLNVEITENGVYEYEPDNFDGYDSVKITVNVPQSGTSINNQTKIVEVVENGDYTIAYDDGYTGLEEVNFKVDVSGYTEQDLNDAYESGITSGVSYQKSLLQDITITHNGEYTNENGYSAITVNVPQSGESIYNQTKSIEYSGNGEYTLTYDEGYTGLEAVNININVPQSAYTSGYTEQDLIGAYNSGITYQKSLLSAVTLTENGTYIYPNGVSAITVNVSGDTPTPPTPSGDTSAYTDMYLTIEALNDGNIIWKASSTSLTRTIQYSKDDGVNWTSVTSTTGGTEIPVSAGDVVLFKGSNGYYGTDIYANSFGYTTSICKVYGNIMSLIYGDNFTDKTTLGNNYTFISLFAQFGHNFDNGYLVDVSNLILPATALTQGCYDSMFYDCTMITTAPALPATTLAPYCYQQMFRHCSRLISAPELPATTLAYMCYDTMFTECYKLTKAPVLPATTLIEKCYMSMFYQCYHLNEVKCLATDLSASNCINGWLVSVSSTGTFTKAQGVTWPTGSSGIPNNWTVIEEN